jgi:hypothetical protein
MDRKIITILASILLVLAVSPCFFSGASAAGDAPPWPKILYCNPDMQKFNGIEYCTALSNTVYVSVIDLQADAIKFEYVIAEGYDRNGHFGECRDVNLPGNSSGPGCQVDNLYPVLSLSQAAKRFANTALVVDSDYGAGTQPGSHRGHGPEGFAVVQGQRIDGSKLGDTDNNAENRPWVAIGSGSPVRVEFSQYSQGEDNGGAESWIYTAFGGGPWLIRNGAEQTNVADICSMSYGGSCYKNANQTAVAFSADKRWLFLVIYPKVSADLHELISVLESLGAADAIKLDGGGSSQLYYAGFVAVPGDKRQLSQYLAVLAGPGDGIDLGNTPGSGDGNGGGGNDGGGISGGGNPFENFWKGILNQIVNWALQKLNDAFNSLLQKLNDSMNQLCGMAFLVPAAFATLAFINRSKHRSP